MDSTKTDTVAPKPHPITIALALVSPLLGVVATVISIYSLYQNQRAETLGQQAYLSVSKTQLTLKPIPPQLSSVRVRSGESLVRLSYSFQLDNFGNTPANLEELTTKFYFPTGWTFKGERNDLPANIGPRLYYKVNTGTDAVLDTNAFKAFDTQLALIQPPNADPVITFIRNQIRAKSRLKYHDSFNKNVWLEWCWKENYQSTYVYPYECTAAEYP